MPRVPRRTEPAPAPPEDAPGAALLASLGPAKPKRKRTASDAKRNLAKAMAEAEKALKDGAPPELVHTLKPQHLVGLYARMHELVYGAFPEELHRPGEYAGAVSSAKKLVDDAFGGKIADAVEFMRWVWREQQGLTKWKRARGIPIRRVEWRRQFVFRDLLTDYRTAKIESARGAREARR